MSKNRPVMSRVGHSGFDHQSLHQIKGLAKKIDFQQNTTDFSSFLVNYFGTVTPTSHQSFGKRTLGLVFSNESKISKRQLYNFAFEALVLK